MVKRIRTVSLGIILAGMLLLTSCGGAGQASTPDVASIQTEAVMQAMAQLTVDAALNPSATPVPATMTPLPTATVSTVTPTVKVVYSGGSSSSSSSSGGSSSKTKVPTHTPDVYKCEIVNQSPWDGPQMTGWIFDGVWTVKNTGLVTWDQDHYYVEWIEDESTADSDWSPRHLYKLSQDVNPYDTVDITVDFQMPTQPFSKLRVSQWGIVNDNGDIFCRFYLAVTYTYPAPTKTPKPRD